MVALHSFLYRLHVGIHVLVQELQEESEVLRVTLVGGGGQEEDVIGTVPEQLSPAGTSGSCGTRPGRTSGELRL